MLMLRLPPFLIVQLERPSDVPREAEAKERFPSSNGTASRLSRILGGYKRVTVFIERFVRTYLYMSLIAAKNSR